MVAENEARLQRHKVQPHGPKYPRRRYRGQTSIFIFETANPGDLSVRDFGRLCPIAVVRQWQRGTQTGYCQVKIVNRSGDPNFQIRAGVSECATAGYGSVAIWRGSASGLNARRICASVGISGHAAARERSEHGPADHRPLRRIYPRTARAPGVHQAPHRARRHAGGACVFHRCAEARTRGCAASRRR